MFTRESFEQQRRAVKEVERREGRILALVSVVLGVGQLVLVRWADANVRHARELAIIGPVFLGYIVLVGWLIWRYDRRVGEARPRCPQCGARLKGMSERIAVATGRCDACGGQVIG
jgi:hypothetical protein